jgi:argininosuccinate lyase
MALSVCHATSSLVSPRPRLSARVLRRVSPVTARPRAKSLVIAMAAEKKKLWGGRFSEDIDPLMEKFNESLSFDRRMAQEDIRGSMGYARALAKTGIITDDERDALVAGLTIVGKEWLADTFEVKDGDEDIHTANERRLGEVIGSVAGKLHTGRSRNDQVATDTRMWLRTQLVTLRGYLRELITVACDRAEREVDVVMPGFTHMQSAQHGRVSDRDYVCETMFWASTTMIHLSRWSEDLIIYSSNQFGFVKLSDAYSTGSSLMPQVRLGRFTKSRLPICSYKTDTIFFQSQKKNPDALELLRGKSGRLLGVLTGFMCVMKGTPTTYNKDFQEAWEGLFDTVDTMSDCLQIATGCLATLKIDPAAMERGLSMDMLATDLAEYLVRKGVPFRETHHISGAAVKMAEDKGVTLADLTVEDLKPLCDAFEHDVSEIWSYEKSAESRDTEGGSSRRSVLEQVAKLRKYLKDTEGEMSKKN